ncbi:NAD(P)H-hydrate dehydratase [Candidatus Uhrbacteria bacterium]|nr:NAD(P)H-hydrate dehydratase [Candidatus Uhrbacteria bacterium]
MRHGERYSGYEKKVRGNVLLRRIYRTRSSWSHKGNFGTVLIIGGSARLTGSPTFNAMAALRAGADLAYLIGHPRAMDVASQYAPDLITEPLKSEFIFSSVPHALRRAKGVDAVIIGGSLARTPQTYQAIRNFLSRCVCPMSIDAEAIRALGKNQKILSNKSAILTPHADEFYALTGERVLPTVGDRKEKVQRWAKKLGTVILLKGSVDVVSDGTRTHLNRTGTAYMTKGGFGDTLAGICGAILARGIDPFNAACAAAYINGKAGEYASKKYGEGTLASDIFKEIPKVPEQGC